MKQTFFFTTCSLQISIFCFPIILRLYTIEIDVYLTGSRGPFRKMCQWMKVKRKKETIKTVLRTYTTKTICSHRSILLFLKDPHIPVCMCVKDEIVRFISMCYVLWHLTSIITSTTKIYLTLKMCSHFLFCVTTMYGASWKQDLFSKFCTPMTWHMGRD